MQEKVLELAQKVGFDLVGIAPAQLPKEDFERYEGWVKKGRAGEMAYLERDPERRRAVTQIMPEAKAVICLGINYFRGPKEVGKGATGKVARYAYGRDYHKIIEKMLKKLVRVLREEFPEQQFRTYVDTGAVLEKAYAAAAGLGEIGQNTMLITPEFGSFVFFDLFGNWQY